MFMEVSIVPHSHDIFSSISVPPRPVVSSMPAYSESGILLSISTEISESQFAVSD